MALNRIVNPASTPASIDDWQRQNELLVALFLDTEKPRRIDYAGNNILKGAVYQIEGVIYVADSNTAITGTPSDYVKITPAGATASASYVANLTGVSWDTDYNGYYDVSGNLYDFNESVALEAGEIASTNRRYAEKNADGEYVGLLNGRLAGIIIGESGVEIECDRISISSGQLVYT